MFNSTNVTVDAGKELEYDLVQKYCNQLLYNIIKFIN